MKIDSNHPNEESNARKNSKSNWASEARRQALSGEAQTASKRSQSETPLKEDLKFANVLKSASVPQKIKEAKEDASEQRRDEKKRDKKSAMRDAYSSDNLSENERVERYESSRGGQFGGSFGTGGEIGQEINLSENFAARSILHIADLERMISTIRTQTSLGGKREIHLELKRSVLKGLKVKITTDPAAQVQIEFIAANEKVRSQIENHSEELADILRGRGVNLQSLRIVLAYDSPDNPALQNDEVVNLLNSAETGKQSEMDALTDDNTFETNAENKDIIRRA